MSEITKSSVNVLSKLIIEIKKGKKQNHHHHLIKKCNDCNIKRRKTSKLCKTPLHNTSHRLDELAQPKKLHLLSVFEQNLNHFSIFQIENFLNILYHRDYQTPNQAISVIRKNINQQNQLINQKKHAIKNLKLLIYRDQLKNVASQIDFFIKELKEFILNGKGFKLNIKSKNLQEQINQKLCQLSEELGNLMKPIKTVQDSPIENPKGLFHIQEYFPSIQSIGPNHIGKTLLWQKVNSKYNCEQNVVYRSFPNFDNVIEEQQNEQTYFSLDVEETVDLENIEEEEIDSSMFEIYKEDCEQINQKGAAFQVEKARTKAMRAMKKKPNDWKCLLDACNTSRWEINWIDKDKRK